MEHEVRNEALRRGTTLLLRGACRPGTYARLMPDNMLIHNQIRVYGSNGKPLAYTQQPDTQHLSVHLHFSAFIREDVPQG